MQNIRNKYLPVSPYFLLTVFVNTFYHLSMCTDTHILIQVYIYKVTIKDSFFLGFIKCTFSEAQ